MCDLTVDFEWFITEQGNYLIDDKMHKNNLSMLLADNNKRNSKHSEHVIEIIITLANLIVISYVFVQHDFA